MNSNVSLSIVVPIYNEEESLPFLVNQLLDVLKPMEETFELVLVTDWLNNRLRNGYSC